MFNKFNISNKSNKSLALAVSSLLNFVNSSDQKKKENEQNPSLFSNEAGAYKYGNGSSRHKKIYPTKEGNHSARSIYTTAAGLPRLRLFWKVGSKPSVQFLIKISNRNDGLFKGPVAISVTSDYGLSGTRSFFFKSHHCMRRASIWSEEQECTKQFRLLHFMFSFDFFFSLSKCLVMIKLKSSQSSPCHLSIFIIILVILLRRNCSWKIYIYNLVPHELTMILLRDEYFLIDLFSSTVAGTDEETVLANVLESWKANYNFIVEVFIHLVHESNS